MSVAIDSGNRGCYNSRSDTPLVGEDMSSPIECEECGSTLLFEGDNWFCPNDDCLSATGERVLSDEVERHMTNPIDVVNNPNHYKLFPDLEVIEAIEKLLTPEEFRGYKKGNSLKYRLRAGKKDSIEQDILKAMKYEAWLLETTTRS